MKNTLAFITKFFISLSILMAMELPLYAVTDNVKVSLAVYPFNDVRRNFLDMDIHDLLSAELSGYEFIEIVPVELIREKLYEIEPQFMWTEKEDAVKRGGILWKIEPRIVEKINEAVNAQYSIYGDIVSLASRWRVNTYLVKEGEPEPVKMFQLRGNQNDQIPAKLTGMAKSIADILKNVAVLNRAEESIRQYKGGMESYSSVIGKMIAHISIYPESIPLRSLLLDLYLEDKEKNREEIVSNGLKIIDMLKQQEDTDTRYLLSLNLDPYDIVAGEYEKRKEWQNAIDVREKTLKLFPYNSEVHREGIGRDHCFLARSLEEKGDRIKAAENYKTAITYLDPSSGYFKEAVEGNNRLKGQDTSSD